VKLNKNLFLFVILLAFSVGFLSFIDAANCYTYTSSSTCTISNGCKWKTDSWNTNGWCEELQCWSLNTQTDCQNPSYYSAIGKNCTWTAGGTSNYCSQTSCYDYSGTNQTYCQTNPSGRSCEWRSECYSVGGTNCWSITSNTTCLNTTGCAWGSCFDKGCYAYADSSSCNVAKDPWSGRNCTWSSSSSSCTESSCSNSNLYPNETACNTPSHCQWKGSTTSGWCETKNCWNFDGNQTGCNTANVTISKSCTWNNGYCNEDSCWNYDSNQVLCATKPGCAWKTYTSSGWCEEVNCWTWDSMRGGNQTQCETLDANSGLTCLWSGNPPGNATNGWCYKDISNIGCSNITTERACYDTYYCWWQATNWSNPSAGGNCTSPTWGSGEYSNSSIVNSWNPGCYTFDLNSSHCENVIGCYVNSGECDANTTHSYYSTINTNGLNCTMINNSDLCNTVPILSSCCSWQNGTCTSKPDSTTCWSQMSQTPNGETMCDDASTQTICSQLANSPWYWPCKWENSTSKCIVKASDVWGNRSQSFVTIENQITCEAVGGKWVTENYCEGSVSVPSGRCEYRFDEERNCNKACFACEYKSDGSAHNSSSIARDACLNSNLGYCEFDADSNAPNGYGYCEAKDEFREGIAEGCSASNCGGCTYMGNANGINGTATPETYCNKYSSSCKWVFDNSSAAKGYCVDKSTETCEDSCDRCYTTTKCANDGRTNVANQSGTCKWQGTDDDGYCVANIGESVEVCWNGEDDNSNNLIDCADPGCYSDSFCGFTGGDCFIWKNQTTCTTNSCEWVVDKWGSWCDFKGSQCWKYDKNQSSCQGITQVANEALNISSARIADNSINGSVVFSLSNIGTGWVNDSFVVLNATGTVIGSGNYTVNYTTKRISFVNTTYMVSGVGQGNITNITYQYYTNTSKYCEWNNGSGSGWCEQDWSIAEQCMSPRNQTACQNTQVGGVNCTWTADTWCNGQGNSSEWCSSQGGWCDHPDFKPKNCWQYTGNSTCSTGNCSWKADQWSQPHCEVNWSNNCWNYSSSGTCGAATGCSWRTDSWGGWCDNSMGACWSKANESACNSVSSTCGWRNTSFGGECQPKCFGPDASTSSSSCASIDGCYWKSESGWCEEKQGTQCWNSTNSNSEGNCTATAGCRWNSPGWCSPSAGFSTGSAVGGGSGGTMGSECYKYDGNQSSCTNSSLINITCSWIAEAQPRCEVDWSNDCWENSDSSSCAANGCWWSGSYCANLMDQCWSNQTLKNDSATCNANSNCTYGTYGCEPKCFGLDSNSCTNATYAGKCKYMTGWCNPSGVNDLFDGIQGGAPVPLAMDLCDGSETTQASVDICGFGMKDMGDAYGLGAFVRDFINSSVCNKEKIRQGGGPGGGPMLPDVTGSGNETLRYIVYIDSDGSTSGSCTLDSNSSAVGYEFKLVYLSEWNSNTSKATETFTSYKCDSNKWKVSDIKINTWKKIMCGEIGGPMIAIEKAELAKFPTLYNAGADLRVYVSTAGDTGNATSPLDTSGPGWATPGSIDFEIAGAFTYGANGAKFEDILKKGFVQYEDCFTAADDDNDGNVNCNDWNCQYAPNCANTGVNAANYTDTSMPQVTGVKIEEYPDSALVVYDTNKPSNGTLEFYKNDSTCSTLNASVYDIGVTSANVWDYKLWHTAEVYSGNLNYSLANDTTYYYKLKACDSRGKCAISRCSSFITSSTSKCGFCNFVTRIKSASTWTVSYDDTQDGTYEHVQGAVCGSSAGMKSNYSMGRRVNIKLSKSDGSTYFEFINASLTKTGLNDKVGSISDSGDIISSSTIVGLTSETRDKIINNLHPEICRIKIPTSGACDSLFHCDDNGENCIDRTSESTLLDSANCVWQIPYCEFSTYKTTTTSSSSSSSGGGGGGGATIGGATTTVSESQLNEGFTKQIAIRDKLRFNVSSVGHLLELTNVTSSTATIKVTSEPQTAILGIGENKKFELTGDNIYDISVVFNKAVLFGNSTYRAEIMIKADSTSITSSSEGAGITGGAVAGEEAGEGGEAGEASKGRSSFVIWFIVIALVILVVVIALYIRNRNKWKKHHGFS